MAKPLFSCCIACFVLLHKTTIGTLKYYPKLTLISPERCMKLTVLSMEKHQKSWRSQMFSPIWQQPSLSPRQRVVPECQLLYPVNDKWTCLAWSPWLECRTAGAKISLLQFPTGSSSCSAGHMESSASIWWKQGALVEVRNQTHCHLLLLSKANAS